MIVAQINDENIVTNTLRLNNNQYTGVYGDGSNEAVIEVAKKILGEGKYIIANNSMSLPYHGSVYKEKYNIFELPTSSNDITKTFGSVYINLPNKKSLALIYRCASSLFLGLIAKTYYNGHDVGDFAIRYRKYLDHSPEPKGEAYAIIRDPIERFKSSMVLSHFNVPVFLPTSLFVDWLLEQNVNTLDLHFRPQVNIIGNQEDIALFNFVNDLTPLAKILELPTPLPVIKKSDINRKPILTDNDIKKLKEFYFDDIVMYESLKSKC